MFLYGMATEAMSPTEAMPSQPVQQTRAMTIPEVLWDPLLALELDEGASAVASQPAQPPVAVLGVIAVLSKTPMLPLDQVVHDKIQLFRSRCGEKGFNKGGNWTRTVSRGKKKASSKRTFHLCPYDKALHKFGHRTKDSGVWIEIDDVQVTMFRCDRKDVDHGDLVKVSLSPDDGLLGIVSVSRC
jgi:hypothetical protein